LFIKPILKTEKPFVTIGDVDPPKVLYHWSNVFKLDQMANDISINGFGNFNINSRRIKKQQLIAKVYPQFGGKKGLFAWKHPVTAMMVSDEEDYTMGEDGRGAGLLKLTIDREKAKVVTLRSYLTNSAFGPNFDLNNRENAEFVKAHSVDP